jgi:hypothetical protein
MPKGDLMQAVHVTQKMRELAESVTFRGLFPYHSRICGYTANFVQAVDFQSNGLIDKIKS